MYSHEGQPWNELSDSCCTASSKSLAPVDFQLWHCFTDRLCVLHWVYVALLPDDRASQYLPIFHGQCHASEYEVDDWLGLSSAALAAHIDAVPSLSASG
eukprot:1775719-Karenia_brevis.AAC.1